MRCLVTLLKLVEIIPSFYTSDYVSTVGQSLLDATVGLRLAHLSSPTHHSKCLEALQAASLLSQTALPNNQSG